MGGVRQHPQHVGGEHRAGQADPLALARVLGPAQQHVHQHALLLLDLGAPRRGVLDEAGVAGLRLAGRHRRAASLGQGLVDLGHRGRAAFAIEDRMVGRGRLREQLVGRQPGRALHRLDQPRRPLRSQHVRRVEFARGGVTPHAPAQIGGVVGGQLAGHQGRGVRIQPQVHHRLAGVRARNVIAAIGALADQLGVAGIAIFGAVLLQRGQPGLVDELEQSGRRGGLGVGAGVVAALAPGRPQEEGEVDASRLRGPLDRGLDHTSDGLDGHARQVLPGAWLTRRKRRLGSLRDHATFVYSDDALQSPAMVRC